jgi:hypothetical protein
MKKRLGQMSDPSGDDRKVKGRLGDQSHDECSRKKGSKGSKGRKGKMLKALAHHRAGKRKGGRRA